MRWWSEYQEPEHARPEQQEGAGVSTKLDSVFAVWLHTSPGSSQHLNILICQPRSTQSALEDHLGGYHSFITGKGFSVLRVPGPLSCLISEGSLHVSLPVGTLLVLNNTGVKRILFIRGIQSLKIRYLASRPQSMPNC